MDDRPLPDFRLRSLLALAREGSVTAAAAATGLTQPAVSRQLDELEEEYGALLLQKKGRSLVLTAAGETLLAYAGRIEALYREARRSIAESAGRAVYRLGATLTVAEFYLPPALAAFHKARPEAEVGLVVANTSEIVRRVRSGELSFGVVEGPFDEEGLETRFLAQDSLVAVGVGPAGTGGRSCGELPLDAFLALPLILREPGSGTRTVFENWLAARKRDPARLRPAMEIGSIGTIKALVAGGLGCSVISALAVKAELASAALSLLQVEGFPILRELRILARPGNIGPAAEDFIEFLD
jgi:DNA-binding transcriptional LysR family regulator